MLRALTEDLARALAPLLPHLAEDVWLNLPYSQGADGAEVGDSVFLSGWPAASLERSDVSGELAATKALDVVRALRDDVNKVLEGARNDKLIGASLEAAVQLHTTNATVIEALSSLPNDGVNDLRYIFLASRVEMCADAAEATSGCKHVLPAAEAETGCTVGVKRAQGTKCERCWNYCDSVGADAHHPTICSRCVDAVTKMGIEPPAAPAAAGAGASASSAA